MLNQRVKIKQDLDRTGSLPDFPANSACRKGNWKVAPVPRRLKCRHVDLGDVSPSNTKHFIAALNSSANGIQVGVMETHRALDGWMACNFTSFSTVFQSDGRLIMKGCVQWNSFYG